MYLNVFKKCDYGFSLVVVPVSISETAELDSASLFLKLPDAPSSLFARSTTSSMSQSASSATARSAPPALPSAPWDRLWHLGGGVFPWQLCRGATAVLASAEDVTLYPSRWGSAGRWPGAPSDPQGRTDGAPRLKLS